MLGGDSPYFLSTEQGSEFGTASVIAMLDDYYTSVYEKEKFQQV